MAIMLFYGGVIIIALLSWFIWDKRYHSNHGTDIPEGYIITPEVFIDPINGKELKVYYDPPNWR